LIAVQELLWKVKLSLFIETGIAYGVSILYVALLAYIDDNVRIVGIDIDIQLHNTH
jgi:cephalosporin hydroxylase